MTVAPSSSDVPVAAELIALSLVPHVVAAGECRSVAVGSSVIEAARLLAASSDDALAVVDGDGVYQGLLGLRDIARAAAANALLAPVEEMMQPRRDWLAAEDTPLDALEMLHARGVEHLPVLDGERPLGIVSLSRLVRLLHRQFETLAMQRQRQIFGATPREG